MLASSCFRPHLTALQQPINVPTYSRKWRWQLGSLSSEGVTAQNVWDEPHSHIGGQMPAANLTEAHQAMNTYGVAEGPVVEKTPAGTDTLSTEFIQMCSFSYSSLAQPSLSCFLSKTAIFLRAYQRR